jgi:hypothetical protein
MKSLFAACFVLAFSVACGPGTETPTAEPSPVPRPTLIPLPTIPTYPTPFTVQRDPVFNEPIIDRTNWLILGGDYRAHRAGTGWGNKTDVMILVSVLETDPLDIAVIQFPRNLYVPVRGLEDQWLFAVWGREGWTGLQLYFREVFGVSLDGIFYTDMDRFEVFIDDLGGVAPIGSERLTGAETLVYLRDNHANWELGSYDAEQRSFHVLNAIWSRGFQYVTGDPIGAAGLALSRWGPLLQTDLDSLRDFYALAELAYRVKTTEQIVRFIQLEEPYILRGDTPLEVRGMVPAFDLEIWMIDCVFDQICEADP